MGWETLHYEDFHNPTMCWSHFKWGSLLLLTHHSEEYSICMILLLIKDIFTKGNDTKSLTYSMNSHNIYRLKSDITMSVYQWPSSEYQTNNEKTCRLESKKQKIKK